MRAEAAHVSKPGGGHVDWSKDPDAVRIGASYRMAAFSKLISPVTIVGRVTDWSDYLSNRASGNYDDDERATLNLIVQALVLNFHTQDVGASRLVGALLWLVCRKVDPERIGSCWSPGMVARFEIVDTGPGCFNVSTRVL